LNGDRIIQTPEVLIYIKVHGNEMQGLAKHRNVTFDALYVATGHLK